MRASIVVRRPINQMSWCFISPLRGAVLASILTVAAGFGQSEIGGAALNGTVLDPSGAAIAGAKVTVKDSATGFTRSTNTSAAGYYSFSRVPVGTYDFSFEFQGFKTQIRKGVAAEIGAVLTIDTRMEVGATTETVQVTAEAPLVESTRSTTSTIVNERAVAELPVNGRNFIDFTTLTPGVVKDPTRGGDLAFGGQRGTSNTLLVDGGDSNNLFFGQATGRTGFRPYAFSQDAVQEFQVNANNFPAEIGRAGGGAINVITKSGTNDMHGSAFWFYRDKGMNANTFTNNRAGLRVSPYHFNQFGGSIGGPIIKDKLFFFGNYDGQRNTQTQVITPNIQPTGAALQQLSQYLSPYLIGLDNDVYLLKGDWNASDKDRISVRFNSNHYTGKNLESNSATSALEHTGNNKVTTNNLASSYTRVLSATRVLDVRFNYIGDQEPGEANASGPEVVITNGITFGKNNFSPRYTNAYTYQPIATLSWTSGRHSLKFGVDFDFQRIDNYFPGLFAGQYNFASYDAFVARTPTNFTQAFSGNSTTVPISHPNVNESAAFAQDSWRVNDRLTLNYGVRWDSFYYKQPTTLNKDANLLAGGWRTDQFPNAGADFAPRFGFAYRLQGADKLVLRGGYGIYYARVPGLILSTAILQNAIDVVNFTLTSNMPSYPNILSAPPGAGAPANIWVADPNFKSPRTQQFSLQVESALGRNFALTVGYQGTNGTHLTRTRDINLFPAQLVTGTLCPTNAVCTAAQGTPIQYWRHPGTNAPARPNPAFGRISVFDSGGNSLYNSGFIQISRRFANHIQFLASYTLSKVIDTTPDGTAVVAGSDDSKIAQDTLAPNLDRGPGQSDIRHRFVFSSVWDISYFNRAQNVAARYLLGNWQMSMIAQAQSGRRFNVTSSGDPNNDGNTASDRPPYVGRNTYVGPEFATWDVRVSKDIPLAGANERVKLRLIGEAFNLTNRANFNGIQTGLYLFAGGIFRPTTNFGATQSTFDPRIFQIAAKITF